MINGQLDNYTISVYTLIENNFDFGLKDYPIFDENYRAVLNKAILDTYMMHEIGWINTAVFKHFLNTRMDLIMRNKYNALYTAKAKEFNPLYTLDVYDEYSHSVENVNTGEINSQSTANSTGNSTDTTTGTSENNSENDASALSLHSNYPSENMANGDVESNLYIDSGQKQTNKTTNTENSSDNSTTESETTNATTSNGKTTNNGNTKTTESYSKHSYGSASDLSFAHSMTQFKDYCDQFDLDLQVINELKDLFINIY
jgi:hypothetical protein